MSASDFAARVARNLDGMRFTNPGACHGCAECGLENFSRDEDEDDTARQCADEGGFSWSQCDTCGSTLGGDRYPAHGFCDLDGKEVRVHMDVCADCLCYLANGDLPEGGDGV